MNLNTGRDFENQVAKTLTLTGLNVETEQLMGVKKIDLLATGTRWNKVYRTAVECKDEARPMRRDSLQKIWLDYEQLYISGAVNEILVVTRVPPAASALAWANRQPGLAIQTLSGLNREIFDVTEYLPDMAEAFDKSPDGISGYYQDPITPSGDDLSELIDKWITAENDSKLDPKRPVAILGSYGMGKSSFARHLASRLAKKAQIDTDARIPILIPLGDFAREQTLTGLLGAHLGSNQANHEIPGYTYTRFINMNEDGRFLIILDGLDEMKQLVSWPELLYNLSQLALLVRGDSRVILLGRPTAFETDEELYEALGKDQEVLQIVGNQVNYQQLEIAMFSPRQIGSFVSNIFKDEPSVDVTEVQRILRTAKFKDIARRPVQLWMLAKVLPSFTGDLDKIDIPKLYELVIDQLIDDIMARESEKGTRLAYKRSDRRQFLQRVAYWMWAPQVGALSTTQIPDSIVEQFASKAEDMDRVRRDLVMSAPLDRRLGDKLRFPHRSIQEYLVAMECLRKIGHKELAVAEFDEFMTDEIASFVRSARTSTDLEAARSDLADFRGSLSWRTVHSLLLGVEGESANMQISNSSAEANLWILLLENAMGISSGKVNDADSNTELIERLLRESSTDDSDTPLMSIFILLASSGGGHLSGRRQALVEEAVATLIRRGVDERLDRTRLKLMGEERRQFGRQLKGAYNKVEYDYFYMGGNLSLLPIGREFVGDLRDGPRRLANRISGGHLIRPDSRTNNLDIAGSTSINIRWLSEAAISICESIGNSGRIDGRSILPPIMRRLQVLAFVSNWTNTARGASSIKVAPPISISSSLATAVSGVCSANGIYRKSFREQ